MPKKVPEFTDEQMKNLVALKKNLIASAELKALRKKLDWLKDYRSALLGEGIEIDGVGRVFYKPSYSLFVE